MGVRVPPFAPTSLAVALHLLAFCVIGGPLLVTGALVNDRLKDFSFFRDTLHSLNVYGEFAWWNPSILSGFPFYYIELLFWPGREPLFAVLAGGSWLLGRIGVTIGSYHALFVVYFAFLVPLLVTLSVLALARQTIRRPAALYMVVALMACSPTLMFSISDLGAEVTAYGFLLAAAFAAFLRTPGHRSFLLLSLAAMAAASALTYFALVWNIVFVPLFVLLACLGPRGVTARASAAFHGIPRRWWAAAAAGVAVCALPSIVTFAHGGDIVAAPAAGGRFYAYDQLRAGTPLEALAVSTPGIGFEWTDYDDPNAAFQAAPISAAPGFRSFGYMGLLTLPLVCLGLVRRGGFWSLRLFACIAAVMTILVLSAYSPIFSMILGWPTPLRGVNHYSDAVVRLGLCPLFAMAAGLGIDWALRSARVRTRILPVLFTGLSAAALGWLLVLQGSLGGLIPGLAAAFVVLYAVVLTRFARASTAMGVRRAIYAVLVLVVADTFVFAAMHLRLSYASASGLPDDPPASVVGTVSGDAETNFLYLRGMQETAIVDPAEPVTASLGDPVTGDRLDGSVTPGSRTYNSVAFDVTASGPARLEWRDAYFPFWQATVNGNAVVVQRTPEGMKAVPVPAGRSDVLFHFSPWPARAAMLGSHVALLAAAGLWVASGRRRLQQPRVAR